MQKQYDIHRAARPHDQGTHEKYKGAVDFCGGAYGILKEAVRRERDMARGGTACSAGAGGGNEGGIDLQRRRLELEMLERENKARAEAVQITEREKTAAVATQALQSQVPPPRLHRRADRSVCVQSWGKNQ